MTPAADAFRQRWGGDPFDLNDGAAYTRWREAKLDLYPLGVDELMVEIADTASPTAAELAAVRRRVGAANMCLIRDTARRLPARDRFLDFVANFGLKRLEPHMLSDGDGVSSITPGSGGRGKDEYIPYTTRPINWHTDGYYAEPPSPINAIVLYCVKAASDGGDSALLDPDIAYIRLRDDNPEHIEAFSRSDVLTIPANRQGGREIRPDRVGPVFSVDQGTGELRMRYTARTISIVWRDDAATAAARCALDELLAEDTGDDAVVRLRMNDGDGLVSNNVLHKRSGFEDESRLLYRGRFLDRVATDMEPDA